MQAKPRRCSCIASGFTLIELVVVLTIIGVLFALSLPAVRTSRESARRMSCSGHLKCLGLALHNYESFYGTLPSAMGGTSGGVLSIDSNHGRLSGLVSMLPFLEESQMWEEILTGTDVAGVTYPPMGPAPWDKTYKNWTREIPTFRCPSAPFDEAEFGRTNYAFCIGDVATDIHQPTIARGAFACGLNVRFEDIKDGLSNTIAMGEIGTKLDRKIIGQVATEQAIAILRRPSLCFSTLDEKHPTKYSESVQLLEDGRGGRWADGAAAYGLFNTIFPPNNASCAVIGAEATDGYYSSGSHHGGGAHVVMADGSVRFITESIDSGDSTARPLTADQYIESPVPSPFGIWGGLGTATGNEAITDDSL